jgi:hypothetical protein
MEKAKGKARSAFVWRDTRKRGETNRRRLIAIFAAVGVIAALISFLAGRFGSEKVEDNFKVSAYSVSYTETASPQNTRVSGEQEQEMPRTLLLSFQVEMRDPNFVLGISQSPVVEELADDKGRNIEINLTLPSSFHRRYRPPRFHPRFVPPQKRSKWKSVLRSVLRLGVKRSSRRRRTNKLQPSWMHIDLDVAMNGWPGGKIGCVKGHFHALMAESFEYVDVPFEKSDEWARLTPDIEVQVHDASCDGALYRLDTESRRQEAGSMRPLSPESHIAERLVVDRQLVGPGNRPMRRRPEGYFLPFHVGGNSSGTCFMRQIAKIRYVIAVNPSHCEIPFVLENIPLPKP